MILMKSLMERTVQERVVVLVPECWWEAWSDAIKRFKENTDYIVIWIDSKDVISMYSCDVFYRVVPSLDKWFKNEILTIIEKEWVTHLIPTFEHWIDTWKTIVENTCIGSRLNMDHAILFKDKYATYEMCKEHSIATINTALLKTLPHERLFDSESSLYIKPRYWSWSKDNFVTHTAHQLKLLTPYLLSRYWLEEYIVQPFIEWTHRSVDLCTDWKKLVFSIKKVSIMNWSKLVCVTIQFKKTIALFIERMCKKLSLKGIYNIELIEQSDNQLLLMEINTRLAWWSIYSVKWWMNMYNYCIAWVLPSCPKNTLSFCKRSYSTKIPVVQWVKAVIENKQWEVLLTKRRDVPFRTLPGGWVEQWESSLSAIKREIKEELWYVVKSIEKEWTVVQYGKNNKCYELYRSEYDWSGIQKQENEVADVWFFWVDSLPYPVDSITEWLLEKNSLRYIKNVRINYRHERILLTQKPARAFYVCMKILWNMVTSSSFKI